MQSEVMKWVEQQMLDIVVRNETTTKITTRSRVGLFGLKPKTPVEEMEMEHRNTRELDPT